jgi:outer membrane protein assembly factor BamB
MKRLALAGVLVAICQANPALAAPAGPAIPPPADPEVVRLGPGAYQHLWLSFAGGAGEIKAFVGLRAGKATATWFVGGAVPGGVKPTGSYRLLVDSNDLSLDGDALRGTIVLRQVTIWAPMSRLAHVTLVLEGKREGARFSGTWNAQVLDGGKASGAWTGVLSDEAAVRSAQAFAPGADWTGYYGTSSTNCAADSSKPISDDLSAARPVWRSEQSMGSGWGCGVDGRYPIRAAFGTVCGGASSPVFADGRIFIFHYVPSGEPDPARLAAVTESLNKAIKEPLPIERAGITDFARPLSDTIITCIDPQTGGTVWRTTFGRLSGNYQTHKWRGYNPTACVMGPVVVAADYGGNWVGLKAATGDVLWTIRGSQVVQGDSAVAGPVAAGGLAILQGGTLRAVRPDTGQIVWKEPGGAETLRWTSGGVDRLISIGMGKVTCRDAATGKQLWTNPASLATASASAALISGDMLVGFGLVADKKEGGLPQGWKLSETGMAKAWEDEFLPYDENLSVTLTNDRAYVVGRETIRCLDLASGKRLHAAADKDAFTGLHGPGSNQWLAVVGNRLLLAPEGQHGSQGFLLMSMDLKPLSAWRPPSNYTTAYGRMALAFPVVDGRIFVRGMDGLYCYDLRK